MNKFLILGIVIAGTFGAAFYVHAHKSFSKRVACTMEAKLCSDGSSVGRVGPDCEFAACPSESMCPKGYCVRSI